MLRSNDPGTLSFLRLVEANFALSGTKFREKIVVHPEKLRRVTVHYVIEHEKIAKNLINVPETKATISQILTLPSWYYIEIRISKLFNRNKSTDFNATVVFMTKN